jgi:hypothetical protein
MKNFISGDSVIREEAGETETEDLFEMANLFPDTIGLPATVWILSRGNARHDRGFLSCPRKLRNPIARALESSPPRKGRPRVSD